MAQPEAGSSSRGIIGHSPGMKLRVLSDLHFEFHRDGGRSWIADQRDAGWDVLVLAGDVTTVLWFEQVFAWFREAAGSRPIVYVPGNHEYYGSSVADVRKGLAALGEADPLLHVLDNRSVVIEGQRFVGSTLWFRHSGRRERADRMLNDFQQIGGFRPWVGVQADRSAAFLAREVRCGDVVVTHHLPHEGSVAPQFRGSALNRYFVHDVGSVVEGSGAALWIHGHTHVSCDYRAGQTRILCNPFGYARFEQNASFDEKLTPSVE